MKVIACIEDPVIEKIPRLSQRKSQNNSQNNSAPQCAWAPLVGPFI